MNKPFIFVEAFPLNKKQTQYACLIPNCAESLRLTNINTNKKSIRLVAIAVLRKIIFEFSSFDDATQFDILSSDYNTTDLHMIIQMNSSQLYDSLTLTFERGS